MTDTPPERPARRRLFPAAFQPLAGLARAALASGLEATVAAVRDRLAASRVFEGLNERVLTALASDSDWFSLPGGAILDRSGDNDAALFIVLSGALGVLVPGERNETTLVATVSAGETVGEMALISGDPHSAELVALRDSELLRLTKPQFDALIARHPGVLLNLARLLVRRLRDTTRRAITRPNSRTFALVPLTEGVECLALGAALSEMLTRMGIVVARIGAEAQTEASDWFHHLEAQNDVVLYLADAADSPWAQLCQRQADRILFVANAAAPAGRLSAEAGALKRHASDLVLIHPGPDVLAGAVERHLGAAPMIPLHHLRQGRPGDVARLARFVACRAVALVLAGGGARGFAHVGVLEALTEMRVPIDLIGGSSMGAIVGAGLAMDWDLGELTERLKQTFVDRNPLNDYTLPLVALLRGRKVGNALRQHFGSQRIEDCPRGFFCVSSNLSSGATHTHRRGPLWRALRASVSIPGILPPVMEAGELLVDGGLMNNFPVDVMSEFARGPIIGIDVTGDPRLTAAADLSDTSVWTLLRERMKGRPSIVSILTRSGTVGNEMQRRQARKMADLLFDPPMPRVGLQTWKAFDEAIEAGYTHAVAVIERDGLPPAVKAACSI